MQPLLTVVIPTHKRPEFLLRAIDSALTAAPLGDVEVIVVPNGQDESWKQAAKIHELDPRVVWRPLEWPNACAARNHGLHLARGKYIRFLDDDDYLLPNAARQLEKQVAAGVEISSGPQEDIAANGASRGSIPLPETDDFVEAAFRSVAINLTQGSIFLRDAIAEHRWREDASRYQDYLWSLDLSRRREHSWIRLDAPIAAYCRHHEPRISRNRTGRASSSQVVGAILGLHEALQADSRGSAQRDKAAATALLTHAHAAFSWCPIYLSGTIRDALRLDRGAVPSHRLYRRFPWLGRNVLATEWALLPPTYIYRGWRSLSQGAGALMQR